MLLLLPLWASTRPRAGPDSREQRNRQSLDGGRSKAKGYGHQQVEVTGAITVRSISVVSILSPLLICCQTVLGKVAPFPLPPASAL